MPRRIARGKRGLTKKEDNARQGKRVNFFKKKHVHLSADFRRMIGIPGSEIPPKVMLSAQQTVGNKAVVNRLLANATIPAVQRFPPYAESYPKSFAPPDKLRQLPGPKSGPVLADTLYMELSRVMVKAEKKGWVSADGDAMDLYIDTINILRPVLSWLKAGKCTAKPETTTTSTIKELMDKVEKELGELYRDAWEKGKMRNPNLIMEVSTVVSLVFDQIREGKCR